MKIEIVIDPSRPAPAQSLVSRVAPPSATMAATISATRVARPASRGIRRGTRGRGRKVGERPQKSVADLDAEMEDYSVSNTAAPAIVPAAV